MPESLFNLQSFNFTMKAKKSKQEVQEASTLISDFTDENIEKRIHAAKNIIFVAEVLGGERVKNELIPFLKEEVIFDEPTVVYELFNNIEKLAEVINGGTQYTYLLPLLEDGLEYEQQKVRKKVVEKYFEVVNRCELPKCENQIVASLKKLYANDYDEVKQAFCCVVARKLGLFSGPTQQQLIGYYLSLVEDSAITKRKYAAKYSRDLVRWLSCAEGSILKIIELLSKDKQESNKIYLIDAIIELAKQKSPATLQSYFNIISYQFSWRIRYELISKIEKLGEAMGKEQFKMFLPYYTKYLNDIEPEIRSIANSKLKDIIPFLEVDDIVNRIIPVLKNIPQDTHAYVRNSLANSILHLCPVIGKKATIDHVLPKFLTFLKDEQQQQVKQTIFKKVSLICETLGIETLSQSLLPVLDEMVASQNWRIRSESINILSYLISNSAVSFLNEKIIKIIIDYLKDRANAVRKEGVRLILDIIAQHGQPWVERNIIPKFLPLFKSTTFIHRETALLALEQLAPKLSADCVSKQILANVFYLVQDPVENVRMSACVGLGTVYGCLPKERESIKKLLRSLKEDKDNDVKDMAAKVFSKLD